MADEFTLPYSLKSLAWDANHFFNAQNKYGYTGKGRKLGDAALQCDLCEQWCARAHAKHAIIRARATCAESRARKCPQDPRYPCASRRRFHVKDVACVQADDFVPFQRNYRFSCRVCTQGPEQFELQTNTWTSIVLTAIYNLLLSDDGQSLSAGHWLKVHDIVAWLQEHWGSLSAGRDLEQLTENSAVQKCILYPQNSGCIPWLAP